MRRSVLKKLALVPALAVTLAVPPSAGAASRPTPGALYYEGPSNRYLLGGEWLFRADPDELGMAERWQRRTSPAGWSKVAVPYAWNATDLSDASQAGSVGWYRRDFRLPTSRPTLRWILRFESVNYRARVWLNGNPIGTHAGAYLPFELIARGVKRSGLNRLVIRVDSRRLISDIPPYEITRAGKAGGGWWNDGGILREVYLRFIDVADMNAVAVRTVLPCAACAARIRFRVTAKNASPRTRELRLAGRYGSAPVAFEAAQVPAFGFHTFTAELRIERPRLWTPAKPSLYPVRLDLSDGLTGRPLQVYRLLSGIRAIKVDSNGLLRLNGRRVALRGASMHEDHPTLGAALGPRERKINIALLERLGATITRAHYPLHPQTLELADRHGILVWDEIPVYQLTADLFTDPAVRNRGLRMLTEMIRRDRNHASVLTWSLGNELPSRPNDGQELYLRIGARIAREADPDRPVSLDLAGYPSLELQPVYRKLDMLGINDYFGWYPGPNGQLLGREELVPYLDRMRRLYPREALFVTEFGAEANREGPLDEKGTYAFQRDFMRYHLQVFAKRPYLNGAIAWILKDFRVRPDWDGGNPKPSPPLAYNQKGILDQYGQPKPVFGEIVRAFKATEQVR